MKEMRPLGSRPLPRRIEQPVGVAKLRRTNSSGFAGAGKAPTIKSLDNVKGRHS